MPANFVTPTCRYGHGELRLVSYGDDNQEWALPQASKVFGAAFFVKLYLCPTCGYMEMFDSEPERTASENDGRHLSRDV